MCGLTVVLPACGEDTARIVSRKLLFHLKNASLRIARGGAPEPSCVVCGGKVFDQRLDAEGKRSGRVQRSKRVMGDVGLICCDMAEDGEE